MNRRIDEFTSLSELMLEWKRLYERVSTHTGDSTSFPTSLRDRRLMPASSRSQLCPWGRPRTGRPAAVRPPSRGSPAGSSSGGHDPLSRSSCPACSYAAPKDGTPPWSPQVWRPLSRDSSTWCTVGSTRGPAVVWAGTPIDKSWSLRDSCAWHLGLVGRRSLVFSWASVCCGGGAFGSRRSRTLSMAARGRGGAAGLARRSGAWCLHRRTHSRMSRVHSQRLLEKREGFKIASYWNRSRSCLWAKGRQIGKA